MHYSSLVGQDYAYHHPPKSEAIHNPHTSHVSSVSLERQHNVDAYFQPQGPQHLYRARYEEPYEQLQPYHPHEQRRLSENFSPEVTFTPASNAEELLLTPLLDRPMMSEEPSMSKEYGRRSSMGLGLQSEANTDEFGFKYAPTW